MPPSQQVELESVTDDMLFDEALHLANSGPNFQTPAILKLKGPVDLLWSELQGLDLTRKPVLADRLVTLGRLSDICQDLICAEGQLESAKSAARARHEATMDDYVKRFCDRLVSVAGKDGALCSLHSAIREERTCPDPLAADDDDEVPYRVLRSRRLSRHAATSSPSAGKADVDERARVIKREPGHAASSILDESPNGCLIDLTSESTACSPSREPGPVHPPDVNVEGSLASPCRSTPSPKRPLDLVDDADSSSDSSPPAKHRRTTY